MNAHPKSLHLLSHCGSLWCTSASAYQQEPHSAISLCLPSIRQSCHEECLLLLGQSLFRRANLCVGTSSCIHRALPRGPHTQSPLSLSASATLKCVLKVMHSFEVVVQKAHLAPLVASKGNGGDQGYHCSCCGQGLLLLIIGQISLLGLLNPADAPQSCEFHCLQASWGGREMTQAAAAQQAGSDNLGSKVRHHILLCRGG